MHEIWEQGQYWRKRLQRLIDLVDTPARYGEPGEVLLLDASGRKLAWGAALTGGGGVHDHIILMTDTSWTLYPSTAAGLTAGLAAASSGAVVWVPAGRYAADYTVPAGVELYGVSKQETVIEGMVALSADSSITHIGVEVTTEAAGDAYGIKTPADGEPCRIDDCRVEGLNLYDGTLSGILVEQLADVFIHNTQVECSGVNAVGLRVDTLGDAAAPAAYDFNDPEHPAVAENTPFTVGHASDAAVDIAYYPLALSDSYTYFAIDYVCYVTLLQTYDEYRILSVEVNFDTELTGYASVLIDGEWVTPVSSVQIIRHSVQVKSGDIGISGTVFARVKRVAAQPNGYFHVQSRAHLETSMTNAYCYTTQTWRASVYEGLVRADDCVFTGSVYDVYVSTDHIVAASNCTFRPDHVVGAIRAEQGDRAGWDLDYDTRHASDISAAALRRHLPLPGAAGGLARSDGTDWQRVDGLTAGEISNTPAGGIAATDVQTALNELDTEKWVAVAASDTVPGIVELATVAEVEAGDTERAVTPAGLVEALPVVAVKAGFGENLFTAEDGLLLLGPHSKRVPGKWTSTRGQAATLSGAFHQVAGPWANSKALVIEEGTTNMITNPSIEVDTTGWVSYWGDTLTRVAGGVYGNYCLQVTPGGAAGTGAIAFYGTVTPGTYTFSVYVYVPSVLNVSAFTIRIYDGSFGTLRTHVVTTVKNEWVRVVATGVITNTLLIATIEASGSTTGYFLVDAALLENKPYATTYVDGSLGTGYAWTGTAHASTSTRAATQIDLDAHAGILSDLNTVTHSVWVQAQYAATGTWPQAGYNYVFDARGADDNNRYTLAFDAANDRWMVYINGGERFTSTAQTFAAGTWLHLLVTFDFTADLYRLYINGVLAGSSTASFAAPTAVVNWGIGTDRSGNNCGGWRFGEYAVLGRILTAEQVAALYARGKPLVDMGAFRRPGIYIMDGEFALRSSQTGARVEIDADGIRRYDATGALIFEADTEDDPVYIGTDLLLGGAEPTANGGRVLVLGDNTNNPTLATNTGAIYGKDVTGTVEVFAIDEAGNAAQLTPHNYAGPVAPLPGVLHWSQYHRNDYAGVEKWYDLERALLALEALTGQTFIHTRRIAKRRKPVRSPAWLKSFK